MYKKNLLPIILICFTIFLALPSYAQSEQEKEVIATIEQLFEGMRKGDSTLVGKIFAPEARLLTIVAKEGEIDLHESSIEKFIQAIGTPHEELWDERISSYEIRMDDRLATAWTPYQFYLGETFSHCGVNAFHLYKSNEGWKIIEIVDTRRKTDCP